MVRLIVDSILVSIMWYIAICSIKLDRIDKVVYRKSESMLEATSKLVSKILIGMIILLDIGFMIDKEIYLFIALKDVVNNPIESHILYVANMIVLMEGTTQITYKALQTERYMLKSQKRAISGISALLVLSISWITMFIQSIFTGGFSYIYSQKGVMDFRSEFILDFFLILLPALILLVNLIRYIRKEKIRILGLRISTPIIFFVAITQTIVVKLFVINDLVIWLLNHFKRSEHILKEDPYKDKLLIASSLSFGRRGSKINAYFITAYFSVVLVLWTLQFKPFGYTNEIYENGVRIGFFFSMAIMLFWVIEALSRKLGIVGRVLRPLLIPGLLVLTVVPFYTGDAQVNTFLQMETVDSIYHMMSVALGDRKYLFFLCLFIIQATIAYIMHVITGEAHNDRHYYSVLPILFIVQVMVLAIFYPIFLGVPPYGLQTHKPWILFLMLIVSIGITIIMGKNSYNLFTSKKSDWSTYVSEYWKSSERVYVIIGLITFTTFLPLISKAVTPIQNTNIASVWDRDYIASYQDDEIQTLIQTENKEVAYILTTNQWKPSRMIAFSTADGSILWEKRYGASYDRYKVWDNETVALIKKDNVGFSVINLKNGAEQYDYEARDASNLEFLNLEINDRAVLMTVNTTQMIYDKDYGRMDLDTMGNNFYHLVPGNLCALTKESKLYIYRNQRWEGISGIEQIDKLQLAYYDENGLIIFGNESVMQYNAQLTQMSTLTYSMAGKQIIDQGKNYYIRNNNEVTFFFLEGTRTYAYVLNTEKFTYKVIEMEQKISGFHDKQRIKTCDNEGHYILMDEYQFSLFKHENLLAREWYNLPITKGDDVKDDVIARGEPLYYGDTLIWAEADGMVHCVKVLQ